MLHFDVIVLVLGQLPSPSMDSDRASGAGWARFGATRKTKYLSYHFCLFLLTACHMPCSAHLGVF